MRQEIKILTDWLYYGDDIQVTPPNNKATVYNQAKTERRLYGPAARCFDESAFQRIDLPHDALIQDTPSPDENPGTGYYRYHNAWYRKHLLIPTDWKGGVVSLLFEGAATQATVYVNGCLAGRSFSGYAPFELDITDFVLFGEDNTISVYLDSTSNVECWWYQGLGIYRNVTLTYTECVHIRRDGIFVTPVKKDDGTWAVPVHVEIENGGYHAGCVEVTCEIEDENGVVIDSVRDACAVSPYSEAVVPFSLTAENPEIWDVWNAHMYTARVRLTLGDTLLDEMTAHFGFRTFCFDPNDGFLLNGRRVELQGVNLHGDFSLTGKVMPEDISVYRLKLLKEMGVNACRMAHYPHAAHEMDALDREGMLVLAETRWFSSDAESMKQWEALIRRDRNHPSVILWSAGNEEALFTEDRGVRIARKMFARARAIDPTRPLTAAVDKQPSSCPLFDECDVITVNYNLSSYDAIHEKYPDKALIAGEWCAAPTTRGWYQADNPALGRTSAYDSAPDNGFSATREFTHTFISKRPWVAGGFQWSGIEYRGESLWPRLASSSGALDLFLFKKDAFYQNQSHMLKKPMIHLLPDWNQSVKEGEIVHVWAYTNCDQAELFVNGESCGTRRTRDGIHAEWLVPYKAGEIRAMGINNGIPVCGTTVKTTGAPVKLRFTRNDPDAWLFTLECVDEEDNPVPDASPEVVFRTQGPVKIIGTGSDPADPIPPASRVRKMYMGKIAVYAQPVSGEGVGIIYAKTTGMDEASILITKCIDETEE